MRFCRKLIVPAPRRVIARRPLCASVIARPVVARVNQIAACSNTRRDVGIFAGPSQKPATKREIGAVKNECAEQGRNLVDAMLPVGIEGDDKIGALQQRKRDTGLQGRALSEIDRMPDDGCARPHGQFGSGVGRAVVDDHDLITRPAQVSQNARNRLRFVECGNDDPYAVAALVGASCHDKETSRRPACSKRSSQNRSTGKTGHRPSTGPSSSRHTSGVLCASVQSFSPASS